MEIMNSLPQKSIYEEIPVGIYDEILKQKKGIRTAWHQQKFLRIADLIQKFPSRILDIGCSAGSFLGLCPPEKFPCQVGLDVAPEQIHYAQKTYGTSYRKFYLYNEFGAQTVDTPFDYVTLIEVIEHLTPEQIQSIFKDISEKWLRPHGHVVLSTPNYTSHWPLLEWYLNHFSDISYDEQHITKFSYFNFARKFQKILGPYSKDFEIEFMTTSHFAAPFLGFISLNLARNVSKLIPHHKWRLPFGCLVLVCLRKK